MADQTPEPINTGDIYLDQGVKLVVFLVTRCWGLLIAVGFYIWLGWLGFILAAPVVYIWFRKGRNGFSRVKYAEDLDPADKKWMRAYMKNQDAIWQACGLAENLGDDNWRMPQVLKVNNHPLGLELVCKLPAGHARKDVYARSEHLASAFKVSAVQVHDVTGNANQFRLVIAYTDPLDGMRRSNLNDAPDGWLDGPST